MKITTVLLLITLGLVCSAYAAPIDVQKQIYSLLRPASSSVQNYDDADAQVVPAIVILVSKIWSLIKKAVEKIKKTENPYDGDNSDAQEQIYTHLRPISIQDNDVQEQIYTHLRPIAIQDNDVIDPHLRPISIQDNDVQEQMDTNLRPTSIQDNDDNDAEAQVVPAALVLGGKTLQLAKYLMEKARRPSNDDNNAEAQFIAPLLMLGARAAPLLARAAPVAGRLATRVGPKVLKYGLKYGPDVIDVLRNGDDIETQDDDDNAEAQYLLANQLLPLLLNKLQEQAEAESFLGKLIETTSKHAPELLQYGLKYGPKILGNRDNGETQDDDEDYQIEALLQILQDKADMQTLAGH